MLKFNMMQIQSNSIPEIYSKLNGKYCTTVLKKEASSFPGIYKFCI